jgi:MFS family permease
VSSRGRTLWSPLRHRDFRYLAGSLAISQVGDWLYNVALIVFVFDRTRSAAWVAAAGIVRLLPYTIFGPLGGLLADRRPRKRLMIASDLLRSVLMFGLALVAATTGQAAVAIALSGLATTFAVAYSPCVNAAVPLLVGEEDLAPANALLTTVTNLSYALGPALGGALLVLGSPAAAFAVNGVTFLASAAATLPIGAPLGPEVEVRASQVGTASPDENSSSFASRFFAGIDAIKTSAGPALLVLIWTSSNLLYGQETVLYPLAAARLLRTGVNGVAFLYAAIGIGGLMAAGLAHRLADHPRQGAVLTAAALGCGVPIGLLAFVHQPWIAYLLLLGEGVTMIVLDVLVVTALQRLLGGDVLGRAFGAIDALIVAAILAGTLIAPVVVRVSSLEVALVLAASLTFAAGLAFLPKARAIDRASAERAAELAPRVALLQGLDIFGGASRATLENLAEVSAAEPVAAGTAVISEGEAPDDLFVVISGTLEAWVDDGGAPRVVGALGPGDYFGEIGLFRGVPRTATVRCAAEGELLRIPGPRFLAIVTGETARVATLSRTVQARLATHARAGDD